MLKIEMFCRHDDGTQPFAAVNMSTFVRSRPLYMILKVSMMGGVPLARIGLVSPNKLLLLNIAIAKQQGERPLRPGTPTHEEPELVLSLLRHQEYARQVAHYKSTSPWLYFVSEVPTAMRDDHVETPLL